MEERVEKKRTDEVSNEIIQLILDNEMGPGDKLPNETELAKSLGVGRSTLREAVRKLESRNIVETRQGSGTYISSKNGVPDDPLGLTMMYGMDGSVELAIALIDARIILEPEIAAMAASNITEKQKQELIRLDREVSRSISRFDEGEYSYSEHLESEGRYHGFIAECSGNGVLQNLVPIITSSIRMAVTSWDEDLRRHAIQQHGVITSAICRRDPIGARSAMISHLLNSREFYINAASAPKKDGK